MDTEDLLADAFTQMGVRTSWKASGSDSALDFVIEPSGIRVDARRRALVSEDVAERLLTDVEPPPGTVLIVVGDRITAEARRLLTERRAGFYDLRGRMGLRTDSLVINADVEPLAERGKRRDALSGKAGLEVAVALLMHPSTGTAVRELARTLSRSPSTVSEILSLLRRDGLIDEWHGVTDSRLFWHVAERWPPSRLYLAEVPPPGQATSVTVPLRLGFDDVGRASGWALTESVAAVAYGAPMAVRSGQMPDFYVPDALTLKRAQRLLGVASSPSRARCAVRVAPVPAACVNRVLLNSTEWPLAHPLFVALDLAQDVGRGREILDAWTPDERWSRVW